MSEIINLHKPSISGNEWKYVKDCLDTEWVSSAGKYVNLFEKKIAEYTGAANAIACVNGTSALQLSLLLAGVEQGDEVIVPTITFISPINVVRYNNADPIFMDADDYYNIDAEKTTEFIIKETVFKDGFTYNKKTNRRIMAIIPVHVFGNAACLDELVKLCKERNIAIVEDAAESMGTCYIKGEYSGKYTGTIGLLGCISFNGNKIITTGGGGMILTDNDDLAEKAKYLINQAKDDNVKFIHNEVGYNFGLTNIQAALGVAQLEQLTKFLERKASIRIQYIKAIEQIEGLDIAPQPNYANNNNWLNILRIDPEIYGCNCQRLMDNIQVKGIQSRSVFSPIHLQKPYKDCMSYRIENAQHLVDNSLCLPSSSQLNDKDFATIISALDG